MVQIKNQLESFGYKHPKQNHTRVKLTSIIGQTAISPQVNYHLTGFTLKKKKTTTNPK